MIIGVGTDIIEISRIKEAALKNEGFVEKVFTEQEKAAAKGAAYYSSLAGYFAAKEALSKALGTGFRGFFFKDIEIEKNTLGKPQLILRGRAKELSEELEVKAMHLSISHSRDNAVAFVVLEG